MDRSTSDTEFSSYLGRAYPGEIQTDRLVDVRTRSFSGHVFCLQSSSGLYSADGVVVHNCRHVIIPWVITLHTDKAVEAAQASSKAIPPRFLGKGPKEIREMVASMSDSALKKAFAEGFSDVVVPAA